MMTKVLPNVVRSLARWINEDHMHRLGIANTRALAYFLNRLRFRQQDAWRRQLYRDHLDALLEENGPLTRPPLVWGDGWAVDTSRSLPHLEEVLEDSERIIAERGGVKVLPNGAYRSFFQDVWTSADAVTYPSFLKFATSSDVVAAVSHYLQCIPALSATIPSGIRFVESSAAFDDEPDRPKDSQLYHIDYHTRPNVYVLVLLRDTTSENGPWTFLPRSVSQRAAAALSNWKRGVGYRFTDEQVYAVVDRAEKIEFTYPRGTVLFIESAACMHYGSRNAVKPRHQLMYGYSGVCRTDLTEWFMKPQQFPVRASDSLVRKLVLNRKLLPSPSSDARWGRLAPEYLRFGLPRFGDRQARA